MKKIIFLLISLFSFISFFDSTFALDIFTNSNEIIYCRDNDCSLKEGTEIVKNGINDIDKTRTFSQYVQDVVKYLLTFISVVAVIYVIYAWFKILTSAGNDDEVKKSKTTISSVLIWIVIIWLAYAIVTWILSVITVA